MKKGQLVKCDFRDRDPKAKVVRMLRKTLGEIATGRCKPVDAVLVIREQGRPGEGTTSYLFRSNDLTRQQQLWLYEVGRRHVFGE